MLKKTSVPILVSTLSATEAEDESVFFVSVLLESARRNADAH